VAACSITAPCRSFAAAIAQTIAGGEVIVLDSAGFGPVTITQSVTITAPPGVYAGISVPASAPIGVLINAPAGKIVLRGLTINSTGGMMGISFALGDGVTIERCRISGFSALGARGIFQNAGVMTVRDTVIGDAYDGVHLGAGKATLDGLSIERMKDIGVTAFGLLTMRASTISNTYRGIAAFDRAVVSLDAMTISDASNANVGAFASTPGSSTIIHVLRSQIVGAFYRILANASNGGSSRIHVTESVIAKCDNGVYTTGAGLAIVSHATIVGNGIGLNATNDSVYTLQNNEVFGNTSSSSGLVIPIPYQQSGVTNRAPATMTHGRTASTSLPMWAFDSISACAAAASASGNTR
jgi:hypothetical protein